MEKILIVDDDNSILTVLQMRLEAAGFTIRTAVNGAEAIAHAQREVDDLVLLDLRLGNQDGIEVMEELHQIHPDMPVIILTAHGSIDSAVEAMQRGASNYLTKPFNHQELLLQISSSLEKSRLSREVKNLRSVVSEKFGSKSIVGKSAGMKKVLEQVNQAADTDSIVHIEGESGTGKELIAKTLHIASSRNKGPFVAINCAAIPETLLESELFGYERGAFSGAARNKKGLFAQAHHGSFFMDEISEMPLQMQSKMLRVLEDQEFYPLGSSKTVKVDTRIIVASNKNLAEEVANGNFREDLFYRVHVILVKLPPLRERKEDIPLLAKHFLKRYTDQMNKEIKGFTTDALQKLLNYSWPGNVRELENTIESAVALAIENEITESLILPRLDISRHSIKPLKEARDDFLKDYLVHLIEFTRGNVSQAAKLAGKYRADLYELLKKYQLDPADFREKS